MRAFAILALLFCASPASAEQEVGEPSAEAPPAQAPSAQAPSAQAAPAAVSVTPPPPGATVRPQLVTAAPPGGPDVFLWGESTRMYFGVTPASPPTASSTTGIGLGGTGLTNSQGGLQAAFSGFAGGSWTKFLLDPTKTLWVQGRGYANLSTLRDNTPTGENGYGASLSVDSLQAEYLHYLGAPGQMPYFAGAWGSSSGLSATLSKAPAPNASKITTLNVPVRLSIGAGVGRTYPIHWRLLLARLEKVLMDDGALAAPLSEEVARRVLGYWYSVRNVLRDPAGEAMQYGAAHQRAVFGMLQILQDAGMLKKSLHLLSAYRLERILEDPKNVDRWEGWDARLGLRVASALGRIWTAGTSTKTDPAGSLAIELTGRSIYNLSLLTDLRIEPSLGIALRESDMPTNTLSQARRVSLQSAPALGNSAAFIPSGRVVLDVPILLTRYIYDPNYNLTGSLALHTGLSAGYVPKQTDGTMLTSLALSAGVAYTFLTEKETGYTLGFNAGAGYQDGFTYNFALVAVMSLGTGDTAYTAPDQVGDSTPFDTSWLPRPPNTEVPQ